MSKGQENTVTYWYFDRESGGAPELPWDLSISFASAVYRSITFRLSPAYWRIYIGTLESTYFSFSPSAMTFCFARWSWDMFFQPFFFFFFSSPHAANVQILRAGSSPVSSCSKETASFPLKDELFNGQRLLACCSDLSFVWTRREIVFIRQSVYTRKHFSTRTFRRGRSPDGNWFVRELPDGLYLFV